MSKEELMDESDVPLAEQALINSGGEIAASLQRQSQAKGFEITINIDGKTVVIPGTKITLKEISPSP